MDLIAPRSESGIRERIDLGPEVAAALSSGAPVVALESTLISHGLPYPQNLDVAKSSEAAVRASGAVPATIAIRAGRIRVGLDEDALEELAVARHVLKAARPSLAAALEAPGWAATTVSATMIAAHAAGIDVFATGGIGGVHRGAFGGLGRSDGLGSAPSLDVSSDLEELARTPMIVVCAGPKAILDVPATLEYLETRGVPVIAIGQSEVPGFFSRTSGIRSPIVASDIAAAAATAQTHLRLGLGGAVLVCVPVPAGDALPVDEARTAVDRAIADAERNNVRGPELTPWLLARVAEITNGASIRANTALIVNDARVAGEIASALSKRP